jgi:lysozyme
VLTLEASHKKKRKRSGKHLSKKNVSKKTGINYSTFGMLQPGRTYTLGTDSAYRYAFNGMMKDNNIYGNNNAYTTEFREIDPRLGGRWWSVDPKVKVWESPYVGFSDNPILYSDPVGASSEGPGGKAPDDDNASDGNGDGDGKNKGIADQADKSSANANKDVTSAPNSSAPAQTAAPAEAKTASTDDKKDVKDLALSQKGEDFIKSYEQGPDGGAALQEYDDKNKNWKQGDPVTGTITIGYGHAVKAGEDYSKGVTQEQADALFTADTKSTIDEIKADVTVQLSQQQFDAIVSYVFNVGQDNSLVGTKFISNLNSSDYAGAASQMDINKSGGTYMQGLQDRRVAEQNIFNNGIYTNH